VKVKECETEGRVLVDRQVIGVDLLAPVAVKRDHVMALEVGLQVPVAVKRDYAMATEVELQVPAVAKRDHAMATGKVVITVDQERDQGQGHRSGVLMGLGEDRKGRRVKDSQESHIEVREVIPRHKDLRQGKCRATDHLISHHWG
jgi:hypothetical protein